MSREAELYKDKIEVSLDGRQIFYLFFGGSVIVGLVFVLGVMVGRRVEARGHTDRARVAATVDPLAALDRLEGGNGLTFQGALRGGDAPASDVEKTIAAMPKHDPAAVKVPEKAAPPKVEEKHAEPKVEDKKLDDKKPEPKVEPKVEAKVEPKVEAKKVEPKVEAKKVEPKVEPKVETKKLDKPEAKKTEPKAEDKKLDAKAEPKADDKKAEAKVEVKAEDKKPEEKKAKYTLQLSSFQDKSEAQAYLESVKSAGYSAYVTEGAVDGKQYFRVRLGSYKTMDAANAAKADVEKATKKSAVVMKI